MHASHDTVGITRVAVETEVAVREGELIAISSAAKDSEIAVQ
jgi:hypothetical protein